jgi:hypothetical protein
MRSLLPFGRADIPQKPVEIGNFHRFDQVVRRSQLSGSLSIMLVFGTAENDYVHWGGKRLGSHPIQHLESVQDRHFQIQEYDPGEMLIVGARSVLKKFHGLGAVGHMLKGTAHLGFLKCAPEKEGVVFGVFHQQQERSFAFGRH